MATIATVLKTGGDFNERHVDRLRRQFAAQAPGVRFVCLSDAAPDCEVVPLSAGLPGWWSKLELFAPGLAGGVFFADLDTTLLGPVSPMIAKLEARGRAAMLEDFYSPGRLASGLMYLPEAVRAPVWRRWSRNPAAFMKTAGAHGDQAVIARLLGGRVDRLQALFPGSIVSFKRDCRVARSRRDAGVGAIPPEAVVVCHHGKPRPWDEDGWTLTP
jgi:hypothetical protein